MDRQLTPQELHELLSAYALDALDDDERAAVEEHLARDAEARAEVAALQRTASYLAYAGGPPPPGVWERLEVAIRGTSRPEEDVPPPRLVPAATPTPRHRRERDRVWPVLAAAAVIVAVLAVSLWAIDRHDRDQPADTSALAAAAATAPGARHAALRSEDGTTIARAVVLPDGTGYLTASKLPPLNADRTYQLWGVDDHATISLGVLGADPKVIAFHASGDPNALAITNERAGGVVSSSQPPTAVGELTA